MDKYQQLRQLGRGAFGIVHLYRNIDNNESYAIKKISIEGENKEEIEKTKKEAIILKKINSYYVVKCYDSFIEDLNLYIVLQYFPNGTLRDLIEKQKQEPLNEELIWEIFLKICLGLAAFHTNKIIHRDLKPENIFMLDNNTPKIGDAGLSRNFSSQINSSAGTLLYLPPEVLSGNNYSEKSDVWAIGVILYQLCTFQLPFSNFGEIKSNYPKSIPKNYSKEVQTLINELLVKDYKERTTLFQIFNKENTKKKLHSFNLYDDASKLYPKLNNSTIPNKIEIVALDKIPENEIKKLFEKYPPLNDGTVVELKKKPNKEDNSIYYGEWSVEKNVKHGRGIQLWRDGRKYQGYWKNDKQDVKGIKSWPDGKFYEGDYKEGKRNGKGILKLNDGDIYEGDWKDDKKEGQGIFTWSNGDKYIGDWKNDKKDGQGIFTWSNGDKYIGDWKDDKKDGQGIFTWSNGDKYIGDWKDDKKEDQGIFTDSKGNKYIGDWKDDKKEGQGMLTYSNGDKYIGDWKHNKKNGQGIFTYLNGDKYIGDLKNDNFDGQSICTYSSGDKYIGDLKDNKKEGQGIFTYSNGNKYIGDWKNDKKKGQGIYICQNGDKYIGDLKGDKFDGQGICTWSNGDKYMGNWRDDKKEGQGIFTYSNGSKFLGDWKNGKNITNQRINF